MRQLLQILYGWCEPNLRNFIISRQPLIWILAIIIGVGVSLAAILFRLGIGVVQLPWIDTTSEFVASAARSQTWWIVLAAPTIGGIIVGLVLQRFHLGRRTGGVADVIEARIKGNKNLGLISGLRSAVLTIISLGSGASAGREGPIVHLGATLSNAVASGLKIPGNCQRILLACGVASAISSSFNAPIAGVLFAHEVILNHYAIRALVPIVIASVVGVIPSRLWFGDVAAFEIPLYQITSYFEFPLFFLLGVFCALIAILFQFSIMGMDFFTRQFKVPFFTRPMIGGFFIGLIALVFPEILGVGYEATDQALKEKLSLSLMLALIIMKMLATSITLASRFGGGVFSPALYIGAMTGGAFGIIASNIFPEIASTYGLYAILGMGAVSAAVLGAPISTTLIAFELTGSYNIMIVLLLTVSISVGLTMAIHGRSFFHWQLEMRGLFVQSGPHTYLAKNVRVINFLQAPNPEKDKEYLSNMHHFGSEMKTLKRMDTLETALQAFDETGLDQLPVIESEKDQTFIGWVSHINALSYFNSALIEANIEHHR